MRWSLLPILFCAAPALADSYSCSGTPGWTLDFDTVQARFAFPATAEMEVRLVTPAEGADWPRAFTLIGARDTAIALLERERCGEAPYRVHVMTQRGQTPILLTGCCQGPE